MMGEGVGGGGSGFNSKGAFNTGSQNSTGHDDEEDTLFSASSTKPPSGAGSTERKKRVKKISTNANISFYLKFLLGIGVIAAYFSYQYSNVRDFTSKTHV